MQMLTPGGTARTPGVSTLVPYSSAGSKLRAGIGSGGAVNTVAPAPYVPYSSPGARARAGEGTDGATNTVSPAPYPPVGGSSPAGSSGNSNSNSGGNGGSSSSNDQSIYNLDTDPIVQRIKALNANNYANAVSGAQANAKQDLIGGGFNFSDILAAHPELAQGILGSVLADQATAQAAQQNPYSTAANLALGHNQNVHNVDQTDNAANLYYSSTRANQLGDEAHQYLGNIAGAQDTLAQALASLIGGVTSEQSTENQNLANAYSTARENAVTNAINSGEVLLGYDNNGNPIFTAAPSADTATSSGSGSNSGGGSTSPTAAIPYSSPGAQARAGIGTGGALNTVTPATLAAALAPYAKKVTANKTGATVAPGRGVISIH